MCGLPAVGDHGGVKAVADFLDVDGDDLRIETGSLLGQPVVDLAFKGLGVLAGKDLDLKPGSFLVDLEHDKHLSKTEGEPPGLHLGKQGGANTAGLAQSDLD